MEDAADRLPRQVGQSVFGLLVDQSVFGSSTGEREVGVEATSATIGDRFPEKGEEQAVTESDLARHHLEEEGIVAGPEGIGVTQGQLELAVVVLGVDGLEREIDSPGGGHDLVDDTGRVDRRACPVDVGTGSRDGSPSPLTIRLEQERLQLDSDPGVVAVSLPGGYLELEHLSRRQFDRCPVTADIADDDTGGLLPTGSDVVGRERELDIGQARQDGGALVGRHLPIESERKQAYAVGRATVGVLDGQVLPPRQAEVIGKHHPNPVVVGGQGLPPLRSAGASVSLGTERRRLKPRSACRLHSNRASPNATSSPKQSLDSSIGSTPPSTTCLSKVSHSNRRRSTAWRRHRARKDGRSTSSWS